LILTFNTFLGNSFIQTLNSIAYKFCNFYFTESQNHRMFGVGRDLCGSSSPTLLPKQGHLQQAAYLFPCFCEGNAFDCCVPVTDSSHFNDSWVFILQSQVCHGTLKNVVLCNVQRGRSLAHSESTSIADLHRDYGTQPSLCLWILFLLTWYGISL